MQSPYCTLLCRHNNCTLHCRCTLHCAVTKTVHYTVPSQSLQYCAVPKAVSFILLHFSLFMSLSFNSFKVLRPVKFQAFTSVDDQCFLGAGYAPLHCAELRRKRKPSRLACFLMSFDLILCSFLQELSFSNKFQEVDYGTNLREDISISPEICFVFVKIWRSLSLQQFAIFVYYAS